MPHAATCVEASPPGDQAQLVDLLVRTIASQLFTHGRKKKKKHVATEDTKMFSSSDSFLGYLWKSVEPESAQWRRRASARLNDVR